MDCRGADLQSIINRSNLVPTSKPRLDNENMPQTWNQSWMETLQRFKGIPTPTTYTTIRLGIFIRGEILVEPNFTKISKSEDAIKYVNIVHPVP